VRRSIALTLVLSVGFGLAACKSAPKEDKLLKELANLDKETIFERAEALYEKEKYEDSRRMFSFLYDTFPNDPLGHKAALRVADTYAVRTDSVNLTEARLRYKDFANRYPNDPSRDYALLMLGKTYTSGRLRPDRDLTPIREALDAYQQVITLYPSSPHVEEARTRIAELRGLLAEHEWQVAQYYIRNKRWRGALSRLENLKQSFPEYPRMAEVESTIENVQQEAAALNPVEPPVGDVAPTDKRPQPLANR